MNISELTTASREMKNISITSRRALLLVPIVGFLVGTMSGCESAKEALSDGTYPDPRYFRVIIKDNGKTGLQIYRGYSVGRKRIDRFFDQTLYASRVPDPNLKRQIGHTLLRPRSNIHRLGTVYKLPERGFSSEFDESFHPTSEPQTEQVDRAAMIAGVLPQTLKSLLVDSPASEINLRAFLSQKNKHSFKSIAIPFMMDEVSYEYLPFDSVIPAIDRIKKSRTYSSQAGYVVFDRLIRAKQS